jgi:hypothetical protein
MAQPGSISMTMIRLVRMERSEEILDIGKRVTPYAPQPPSMASALTSADHTSMGPPSQLTLHVR